jgi:sodium/potassium/calcium exchanger 6
MPAHTALSLCFFSPQLVSHSLVSHLPSISISHSTHSSGLLNFPQGILGLTLLAWGNSLGDFFGNRAMAKAGHASMAITACFAAPLFNILISLSMGFSSLLHKLGTSSVAVSLTPEVLLGGCFLMGYNLTIVLVGRCCGQRLPAWFATFARCWYALYFVLACVSGVMQHYHKLW